MPSNERDPRKDPRPGDVLKDEFGVMLVSEATDGAVEFFRPQWKNAQRAPLSRWIDCSKDDEVLHVAE